MLIDDRSIIEMRHDKWSSGPFSPTTDWNGRELYVLDRESGEDISNHFSKARFMEDAESGWVIAKDSTTTSQTDYDVKVKTDSDGKTTATASVGHSVEKKDDKGNSDKLTLEGKGSIDNKGKTSGEVGVKFTKTY